MRELATALELALEADHVEPVFFVDLEVDSGAERLHSSLGTLSFGGNDYVGVGSLGSISTVEEGVELSPYAIQLGLSGVDQTILNIVLTEEYIDRPCKVWLGALVDGALVSDPALLHSGFLAAGDVELGAAGDDNTAETTDAVSVTSESELAIFERSSAARYTEAQLQAEFAGDLGLQYLDQVVDAKVVWRGKQTLAGTGAGGGAQRVVRNALSRVSF